MDATVTWKGAVPFDQFAGKKAHTGSDLVQFDARATATKFDVRPFHSENMESAMKGAIPYISVNDES